ncbi:hypothetical protein OSTOST_25970, partial [Ostertagia ostertagi]
RGCFLTHVRTFETVECYFCSIVTSSCVEVSFPTGCVFVSLSAMTGATSPRSQFSSGMWTQIVLLVTVVGSAFGSVAIQQAKLGERVELSLGPGVVTWKRKTSEGEQFIKYCGPTEKGPRCGQFVKEDNTPVKPKSSAHVQPDGTLVIDSFQKSDVGLLLLS